MPAISASWLGIAAFGLIPSIFAGAAQAAETVPNFSGQWGRGGSFVFEAPASGTGPIRSISRLTGLSEAGSRLDEIGERVGDFASPMLTPQAAEVLKRRGEIQLSGKDFPDPRNQCQPEPPPFILALEFEVQIIQQKDQVSIVYVYGHQVRRIRLNASHPAKITPSPYGDSVGHYEGDTLVVDTIGIRTGPLSMVDIFGTPYSAVLHLVERYRLIDGEAASKAAPANQTPFSGRLDPDTKKDGLQVEFTVEDPLSFTTPWSARITYRPLPGRWLEMACAENVQMRFGYDVNGFPRADKPDF